MEKQKTYADKLNNPKWDEVRRRILYRDNCQCQRCFTRDGVMDVHHRYYTNGKEPWEYPDECFVTLCRFCHKVFHDRFLPEFKEAFNSDYFYEKFYDINITDVFLFTTYHDRIIRQHKHFGYSMMLEMAKYIFVNEYEIDIDEED